MAHNEYLHTLNGCVKEKFNEINKNPTHKFQQKIHVNILSRRNFFIETNDPVISNTLPAYGSHIKWHHFDTHSFLRWGFTL